MKLSESTILVIDDDEEIVSQVRRILENLGVNVLVAHDVVQALHVMGLHAPHLILTDIEMGLLTGFDLIRKLRGEKAFESIPVIVMSVHNDRNSVQQSISCGASDYLIKPIKTGNLVRRVRRGLRDSTILKYEFAEDMAPTAIVTIEGRVHSVGEIGLKVEMSSRLDRCDDVSLRFETGTPGSEKELRFATHYKGQSHVRGTYLSDMIAIPANEEFVELKRILLG